MTESKSLPDLDVAIVGAGISGLYTAWRLLTADLGTSLLADWRRQRDGKLAVKVFEDSDRVGGRLLSACSPLAPDLPCELGGMRFASAQKRIKALVAELGLSTHEQTVYVPNNIAFMRGRLQRLSDLDEPASLPFNFDQDEANSIAAHGSAPDALLVRALKRALPDLDKHLADGTLGEYLQTAPIDPPLHVWGFWNLLARNMSADAYTAARSTVGYDCLGDNYNAVDMIAEIFNFTPDVTYHMVDKGYETVPWTLEQRIREAGGEVCTGRRLKGFDALILADGTDGVALKFLSDPPETKISARAIVLAMPRRAIEMILRECPVLDAPDQEVRGLLSAVAPIPLFKLFLMYPRPWWQETGVRKGRSLTDLPLRQCYYWAQDCEEAHSAPAVIMAYNDARNVSFWSGLNPQPRSAEAIAREKEPHPLAAQRRVISSKLATPPQYFERKEDAESPARFLRAASDKRLVKNWDDHKAPLPMMREMHRQLKLMHGVDDAPEPIDAAFMDWSEDPYGGGVHLWNVGYKSWNMLRPMTQPVTDFPCYVCGEAFSTNQTWVEGALQTAEIVLQDRFGLSAARWAQ